MSTKYNYLTKNVGLFTISIFVPKILSFFLVRLYTSVLTASEYGIAELIATTVSLTIPIMTVCVESGTLRFSIDKNYSKESVFCSTFYILARGILISFISTVTLSICFEHQLPIKFSIYYFFLFVATSTYNFFCYYCNGIDKVNVMVEMSLVTTVTSCLLNVLLLLVLELGIDGYIFANFMGHFVAIIWGVVRVHVFNVYSYNKVDRNLVREIERYCFPLIFNQIGWWLNHSVDKYIVTAFLGTAMTGIYSISYKIPTIMTTFSGIFANAWSLSAIKEFDADDKDGFIKNMYSYYNGMLCFVCSVLLLLNIPLARILYAKDFFIAWRFTGPLMITVIFGALAGFIGALFSAVKDTKIYSLSTIAGGVTNIVFSLLTIHSLGVMGVAIGTLISNIVIWAIRLHKSRKYINLRIPLAKHFCLYILLFIEFIIGLQGWYLYAVVGQVFVVVIIALLNRPVLLKIFATLKAYLRRFKFA